MWLFTKNSFVSIVQADGHPDDVLVRARRRADLIKLFPDEETHITSDENRDYRFRILVAKSRLAERLTSYVMNELDYGNFKAAQGHDTSEWGDFLYRVWAAGYEMQK